MELIDFFRQTQAEVRERINNPDGGTPYEEQAFTEIVMQHMAEIGMASEPVACHHETSFGNAKLRLIPIPTKRMYYIDKNLIWMN